MGVSLWAETWFRSLAGATLQGGVFVLAVWGLCFVFRRFPAWVKAWLWWIACAQLLVRLFLTVPIPVPVESVPTALVPTHSMDASLPTRVIDSALDVSLAGPSSTPIMGRPIADEETPVEYVSSRLLLVYLWLAGLGVGAGIAARRLLQARGLVRRAEALDSPFVNEVLDGFVPQLGRRPRLLHSPSVKCPLLAGYANTAIVFPSRFEEMYSPAEIRMAIAHEVAHLRRWDQWTSLLLAATSTIFFFHPLAWLATREAAIAREEACDLEALRLSGETSTDYAHFLLKSAQSRTPVAALGAAYGYRNLKRRITMLKTSNPLSTSNSRRTWAALIAAGFAAALPWSVVAQSPKHSSPAKKNAPVVTKKAAIAKETPAKAVTKAAIARDMVVTTENRQATAPARADQVVEARSVDVAKASPVLDMAVAKTTAQAKRAEVGTYRVVNLSTPVKDFSGQATRATRDQVSKAVSSDGIVHDVATEVRAVDDDRPIQISLQQLSPDVPLESRMSVKLVRAEVGEALTKLLSEAGCDFVIKAKIKPEAITCRLQNVPAEKALQMILRGIDQDLTFRTEGNVIFIVNRGS